MSTFFRNKSVFARVAFTYAGVEYQPGDEFKAPAHKVQQMWFARKLTHYAPVVDDAPLVTLEHKGAGWYNVLMSGAQMNTDKIKGKDAAIEWAVTNLGVTEDVISV
jgi:hypothetical protein